MNPADNLQSTSIEQQLEQALQELKVSHEERGHLLVALERASEEQDAIDEELEKKDLLIQEKEKELEDIKRLLSETQQMWMDERASFEQKFSGAEPTEQNATKQNATGQEPQNNDENSPLHQQLQLHYQKSDERWTKMEEHIAKASGRLLSLQQRFSQLKQPLDGVLKVMQKVQLQGRKIVDGQQKILNGENTK